MRVALVTEGTYPIHPGGVSRWCDQLLRGLPDIDFDVVALSGSGREATSYELPGNVRALRRVGLWGVPRRPRWMSRSYLERFSEAYDRFLRAILSDGPHAPGRFETAVRALHELAGGGRLTAALRSQLSIDIFLSTWRHRPAGVLRDGEAARLALADVLAVTDLVEHFLRPLQLRPLDVDLVHASANGPSVLVGLVDHWQRGTPLVLSEHGVYLRERILATRADAGTPAQQAVLIRFFVRLTELGYRSADVVLPVSGFNRRWALRCGAPDRTVRVLHNGIDPAAFPPLQDEPAAPTLVFVGRIDPLKDLATLLRAFALVRRRVPDARLRLFGPVPAGNEGYAAACRDLATELGLGDAATFEGPVAPVRRAFAAGHVVVLSSISEGLPLTIIEAAMSGRPVVATDVGGMAEAVGPGGLVVPAGDPGAFADACVRLLDDDGLRRRTASAGRDRALEMFTLDRFVTELRGIYDELVTSGSAPALPRQRGRAARLPAVAGPVSRGS